MGGGPASIRGFARACFLPCVTLGCLALCALPAQASTYEWLAPADPGNVWNNANAWGRVPVMIIHAVPGVNDTALFVSPPSPAGLNIVNFQAPQTVRGVTVQSGSYDFDFVDVGGGSTLGITGPNLFIVGQGSGNVAALTLDSEITGADYPRGISPAGTLVGFDTGSDGTLSVNGEGQSLTDSMQIIVGSSGSGTLNVSSGGAATTTGAINLGMSAGSTGQATVAGADSTLHGASVTVGGSGHGALNVNSGGAVTTPGVVNIANNTGSVGTVAVDGNQASLQSSDVIYVGIFGQGSLSVHNSASVSAASVLVGEYSDGHGTLNVDSGGTVSADSLLNIGSKDNAVGEATVTGDNSKLQVSGAAYIGLFGQGTLTVGDGATATMPYTYLGTYDGSLGTLNVNAGGSVTTSYLADLGATALSIGHATVTGAGQAGRSPARSLLPTWARGR